MKAWYQKQDFFIEEKYDAIKSWVQANTLDFINGNLDSENAVA